MKLGQLIVDIDGTELTEEDIDLLTHPYIGGVILFSRNFDSVEQIIELTQKIKSLRSPSLLIYADQEGGRVQRFKKGMSMLPSIELLGKKYKFDLNEALSLSKKLGWLIGYELRNIGVNVNTAPVLDINYERSNVMEKRCFSDKPKEVAILSRLFIEGAKESGISSICKHYPGHGYAKTDSHVELPIDSRDIKTIFKDDLMPYKGAIDSKIEGIMTSHVLYKNIDSFPPTLSKKWLQILRNDLRFKGVIFSDDLNMLALNEFGEIEDNVLKSIEAGCDCVFICNNRNKVISILDNLIIENNIEASDKLMKFNNGNEIEGDFQKNKRRLSILESLNRITEKKQIEINL